MKDKTRVSSLVDAHHGKYGYFVNWAAIPDATPAQAIKFARQVIRAALLVRSKMPKCGAITGLSSGNLLCSLPKGHRRGHAAKTRSGGIGWERKKNGKPKPQNSRARSKR